MFKNISDNGIVDKNKREAGCTKLRIYFSNEILSFYTSLFKFYTGLFTFYTGLCTLLCQVFHIGHVIVMLSVTGLYIYFGFQSVIFFLKNRIPPEKMIVRKIRQLWFTLLTTMFVIIFNEQTCV